jgi:hypothetical protein
MIEAADGKLVVCAGSQVHPAWTRVLASSLNDKQENGCEFVMSEWLNDEQFRRASLLWVLDDSTPWGAVHAALCSRISLLVPESNSAMKEICVKAGCGLYYRDAVEARYCLNLVLTEDALRKRMGESGHEYMTRRLR